MKKQENKSLYVGKHNYSTLSKVGVSIEPIKRLKGLTNYVGAEILLYYESPILDNWAEVERMVLDNFKEFRKGGEWINKEPEEIIAYIKTIEKTFNNPQYKELSKKIEREEEIILEVEDPFRYYGASDTIDRNLKEVSKGVYVDEKFLFYVTYKLCGKSTTIRFNVFKSALLFSKEVGNRLLTLDLETSKIIDNPKYRIENE